MSQAPGLAYLDTIGKFLAEIKRTSYSLMDIQPNDRVLDVGCGLGGDSISLTDLVGPEGYVVGVDADWSNITRAHRRAKEADVQYQIGFTGADVTMLPFPSDTFAACRSERLFQHLLDPERALSEMARVIKPGGWIVVLDTDWGTLSIDTTEIDIERRIARFIAEEFVPNGYSGRQLHRLFRLCGLQDIRVRVFPEHTTIYPFARLAVELDKVEQSMMEKDLLTADERERWRKGLYEAHAQITYFGSVTLVMVSGRKP
ncbi:MAG: methyltransferase domain-containing protein [Proteobacteria bacterium]|nr:methyltransferase domain-containing protein [Pseudomonadota bacterium]